MKIPLPRDQGYNGGYAGVGSKPAPPVWTPGSKRSGEERERVPRRFRGLRLRRLTRSHVERTPTAVLIFVAIVLGGMIYQLFVRVTY